MTQTHENSLGTFGSESTYARLHREHGTVLTPEETAAIWQHIHTAMEAVRTETRQKAGQSKLDSQELFIDS